VDIVPLSSSFEPLFWKQVNHEIFHYFFFAYDWKHHKDRSRILLAIEHEEITGMMLVYQEKIVQLRGSDRAMKMLFEGVDLDAIELQMPKRRSPIAFEKYDPAFITDLMLMTVHCGEASPHIRHTMVQLDASDSAEIASILREGSPEIWGDVTCQQIVESMDDPTRAFFGIKVDDALASLCSFRLTEWMGHVGATATRQEHRNQGYATSLVSYAVKQMLQTHSDAIIFVKTDNYSAIRVYQKVGFKPYRTYFYMKGYKKP
jgi:ribosomal protein S18 acetylase RimI-like enzyme